MVGGHQVFGKTGSTRDRMVNSQLAKVVRLWALPLAPEHEVEALRRVMELGDSQGIPVSDLALKLDADTSDWFATDEPSALLVEAVDAALEFAAEEISELDGKLYFKTYKGLRKGTKRDLVPLSPPVARRLLSRTTLIVHLLRQEHFSCTQVSRVLAATEAALDVPYGSIAVIARAMKCLPKLSPARATKELWERDQAHAWELFPDSSLRESCAIAATEVERWLPEVDVESLLRTLSGANDTLSEPTWPYLQILHWCLTPLEYFDHPPSYLYEFAPRGKQVAGALFARYPASTGNPLLNNAKAVETLGWSWARNRGFEDAHALVDLLESIESLPYTSRRHVARVIRAWQERVLELCTTTPVLIEYPDSEEQFTRLIDFVAKKETQTHGVLEQRLVDYLAVLAFDRPGWRPRGLGDGVNTTNFSRKKLGDVEFANTNGRTAIAVEAHAGMLSRIYVNDHIRSLNRIVALRLEESWAAIDEPQNWTVRVIFIAHSLGKDLPDSTMIHGVNVELEYTTFADFRRKAVEQSDMEQRLQAFKDHVITPLNKVSVRETTRERFVAIASGDVYL